MPHPKITSLPGNFGLGPNGEPTSEIQALVGAGPDDREEDESSLDSAGRDIRRMLLEEEAREEAEESVVDNSDEPYQPPPDDNDSESHSGDSEDEEDQAPGDAASVGRTTVTRDSEPYYQLPTAVRALRNPPPAVPSKRRAHRHMKEYPEVVEDVATILEIIYKHRRPTLQNFLPVYANGTDTMPGVRTFDRGLNIRNNNVPAPYALDDIVPPREPLFQHTSCIYLAYDDARDPVSPISKDLDEARYLRAIERARALGHMVLMRRAARYKIDKDLGVLPLNDDGTTTTQEPIQPENPKEFWRFGFPGLAPERDPRPSPRRNRPKRKPKPKKKPAAATDTAPSSNGGEGRVRRNPNPDRSRDSGNATGSGERQGGSQAAGDGGDGDEDDGDDNEDDDEDSGAGYADDPEEEEGPMERQTDDGQSAEVRETNKRKGKEARRNSATKRRAEAKNRQRGGDTNDDGRNFEPRSPAGASVLREALRVALPRERPPRQPQELQMVVASPGVPPPEPEYAYAESGAIAQAKLRAQLKPFRDFTERIAGILGQPLSKFWAADDPHLSWDRLVYARLESLGYDFDALGRARRDPNDYETRLYRIALDTLWHPSLKQVIQSCVTRVVEELPWPGMNGYRLMYTELLAARFCDLCSNQYLITVNRHVMQPKSRHTQFETVEMQKANYRILKDFQRLRDGMRS